MVEIIFILGLGQIAFDYISHCFVGVEIIIVFSLFYD